MMLPSLVALASFAASASALPATTTSHDQIERREETSYITFEHAETGAKLQYVNNSGICETTPGVHQYSGYLSVGTNMNMFFWFFEARNGPSTAPLVTWFNGGPGCSSMIGLFQENGPCHFENGASEPSLNPNSWNNYANMLYIDQPIGVGFSYGTDDVDSTETAAPYVWTLLQAFFAQFPQYENREFGIFTESYGGHYGPEFAYYFEQQNTAIDKGTVTGEHLNLIALGVNNGWFDAKLQYKAYIDYAYNNSYKALIDESEYSSYLDAYTSTCLPALQQCDSSGTNSDCSSAQDTCYGDIEGPLSQVSDFDVYDIREPSNDPYPPATYSSYLSQSSVQTAIGAKQKYQECPNGPYNKFSQTGDNSRSFLSQLSSVVQSGNVTTLVWAGDADFICNWYGNLASADAVEYDGQDAFKSAELQPYAVNGKEMGTFKTEGKLSFLRVYGAGHEVPYYQPEVAFQAFVQTMKGQPISST